jgi:hypothetical protein
MSYNGYLVKVGNYTIPQDKIRASSYSAVLHVQDLDSFRDANGVLNRMALEHKVPEVNFELVPMLTNEELSIIFSNIRKNYTNASERKVIATVYIPELDDYISQAMYIPDVNFPIYGTYNGKITYNPIPISLIGY